MPYILQRVGRFYWVPNNIHNNIHNKDLLGTFLLSLLIALLLNIQPFQIIALMVFIRATLT
jgi:hypothetical protein